MNKKIVLLAGLGDSTTFMYNGLKDEFNISNVIIEASSSRKKLLKRRLKRLGLVTVFGQLLFQVLYVPLLRKLSLKRIHDIKNSYHLDGTAVDNEKVIRVTSVNSDLCLQTLKQLNPDVIIVNGTGIISKKVLNSIDATFINTHAGITPNYRGVHGGYWALANDDKANCGVTVHLVDPGIDTGGILYQALIEPTKQDNFTTYTYLQIGEGIQLMKKAINSYLDGNLKTQESTTNKSALWYHPTLWYYLSKRLFKGVK
ncbi:MAG: formyl transferase [Chlorobi bacterium]|nr:formyl transferase [Chlorobiota bacterium]